MRTRLLFALVGIAALAGMLGGRAWAAPLADLSESCQSYAGSNACRMKGVQNIDSSTWGANMRSQMKNPQINIDVIGRSWWTVRETCNGSITYQAQYGGAVDYNDYMFFDAGGYYKHSCSGNRVGWSMGNHDFHKSGYTHIYPYKEHSYPLN
jgi:hypothetical protein